MLRLRWARGALLIAWAMLAPICAMAQLVTPAPWQPAGSTTALTATTASQTVQLFQGNPGPSTTTLRVCNKSTSINAYVLMGNSNVTVTSTTGSLVQFGFCIPLAIANKQYIAAITPSSTAALEFQGGTGSIAGTGGGGGTGGGAGTPGGSTDDLQYNAGGGNFGGITLTDGQTAVGQTGSTPLAKSMSGDCTRAATGAVTCTKTSGTSFGSLATLTPGAGVATAAAINVGTSGALLVKGTSVCGDLSNATTACSTATGTSGATLPLLNGANTWSAKQTMTGSGPLEVGANGGNIGSVKFYGNTSGDVTLKPAAIAGTATNFTLPATNGSNTNVLQTDGSGNTSWVAAGAGNVTTAGTLTSGKVLIGQGTTAVDVDASAGLVLGALTLGASGTAGSVAMGNPTSGTVTLQPVAGALGSVTASLPANTGTIAELNLAQTWTAKQTMTAAGPLELGANSGNVGSVKIYGNTSGDATIVVPAIAGTATRFQLPATNGSNTNVLQTDGSGNTSWVASGGSPAGVGVQGAQSPTGIGDNTTALSAGKYFYYTNANMTAPRTHNLMDNATQGVGNFQVCDAQQTVTSTNFLTLAAPGTNTLNGVTNGTAVIYAPGGCAEFHSDGAGAFTTVINNTTPSLNSTQIYVGNASNFPAAATMSQDCTIGNTGVITCLKTNNVSFTALATTAPGTGVATALGIAVGSGGGPVTNGGALGTPSSGTGTNITAIPNANVLGVTVGSGTTHTMGGANGPREYWYCTGTCTVTMPVPAAGQEYCVATKTGVNAAITMAAIGSSAQYPKTDSSAFGTAGTGTMVSTAALGNKICLVGLSSTLYELGSYAGSWTVN